MQNKTLQKKSNPLNLRFMSDKKEKQSIKATEKFIRQAYWHEVRKHRWFFLSPTISLFGVLSTTIVVPIFYSQLIQDATTGRIKSLSEIFLPLAIIISLYCFKSIANVIETRIYTKVLAQCQNVLTSNAFEKLSSMSKSFFADSFTGSLTGKASSYFTSIRGFISSYIYNLLPSIVSTIIMLFYMATKSLVLVFPLIVSSLVYTFVIYKNRKKNRAILGQAQEDATILNGRIADSISSMDTVKAEGSEVQEQSVLKKFIHKATSSRAKSINFQNTQGELVSFLSNIFVLLSIIFALYLYVEGKVTLSVVIIMNSYAGSIISNVAGISRFRLNMQDIYSQTYEMAEIMMTEPEIKDPANPTKLKITKGEIQFQNTSFKYTDSSEEVTEDEDSRSESGMKESGSKKEQQHLFKNLSLTIHPGEKIGLVGPSGGGKSTLLKLILRFYDVDSGQVLIDGVNVKDVIQSKLRQQIAYVPQDPTLFHRSIGENIGYSKPKATQKEVELAAKQAYVDEFIQSLPEGYETLVGERGVKLSGGQRQRVAIARAILKDAPILLLDEATSALDSESESYIQKSLEKLMKGRTTVVVAHRLSTIRKMDRIIVVDKGRVVDSGPHEQLLKTSPLYKKLWSHQSGGILQD